MFREFVSPVKGIGLHSLIACFVFLTSLKLNYCVSLVKLASTTGPLSEAYVMLNPATQKVKVITTIFKVLA